MKVPHFLHSHEGRWTVATVETENAAASCFMQREAKRQKSYVTFLTEIALLTHICFLKRCYGVLKTCIYRTRNDEMT